MPKFFKSLVVALALPLVLAGCKINSINYFPPTPAHFRVVNVLGTTTPINVAVNGVTSWSGLNFEAMTGYLDFENTSTKISVTLVGSTTPLVEQTFAAVTGNQSYTIVVYGTTVAPTLGVMADATKAPNSGQFDLNVFNAAPVGNGSATGTYPIDIYLTPPGQALDNISPTFPGVTYSNANNFGQFPSGQYQMRMTIYNTKTVIYDSGSLTFPEKTATDLIVYSRGSTVLTNALLNDSVGAGQQVVANNLLARYKVVNAAFETGPVNALRNGNADVSEPRLRDGIDLQRGPLGRGYRDFRSQFGARRDHCLAGKRFRSGYRPIDLCRGLCRVDQCRCAHRQQFPGGVRCGRLALRQCIA